MESGAYPSAPTESEMRPNRRIGTDGEVLVQRFLGVVPRRIKLAWSFMMVVIEGPDLSNVSNCPFSYASQI